MSTQFYLSVGLVFGTSCVDSTYLIYMEIMFAFESSKMSVKKSIIVIVEQYSLVACSSAKIDDFPANKY